MKIRRKIVQIDEDKCNGCGECVTACAEGAIELVDGKARLVSESYCDGLGACLGECPQDAITIEDREADAFDEEAVAAHLAGGAAGSAHHEHGADRDQLACGCPSAMAQTLEREEASAARGGEARPTPSQLANWPVQIHLVPPTAPYLKGAELVIAADCTAYAYADFHRRFLAGRVLLVGCPKLDDAELYRAKLSQVFAQNGIRGIEVVYMEVPCCTGLVRVVQQALEEAGEQIPLKLTKIAIGGEIAESSEAGAGCSGCS